MNKLTILPYIVIVSLFLAKNKVVGANVIPSPIKNSG